MPYNGSDYRPPLPPRGSRPPSVTSSAQGSGLSYFPPPPTGPPPRISIPGSAPSLPPRPPGFPGSSLASAGASQVPPSPSTPSLASPGGNVNYGGPTHMSFPPPPVSPNRPHAAIQNGYRQAPPLPPRPVPSVVTGIAQAPQAGPSNMPTASPLSPGAQSPNELTSFPPPPPGPPSSRTSLYIPQSPARPSSQPVFHTVSPSPQQPYIDHSGSRFPLTPDPPVDSDIPSSPPPAYTLLAEPPTLIPPPPAPRPSAASSPVVSRPVGSPTIDVPTSAASPPLAVSPPAVALPPSAPPHLPVVSPPVTSPVSCLPLVSPPTPALPVQPQGCLATALPDHSAGDSVSNPGTSDSLSFFPRVSPMPRSDPIEELLESMNLGPAPSTGSPAAHPIDENPCWLASSSTSPSQTQELGSFSEYQGAVVPPLRPAKIPLPGQSLSAEGSPNSHSISSFPPPDGSLQTTTWVDRHGDGSSRRPLSTYHAHAVPQFEPAGRTRPASTAGVIDWASRENEEAQTNPTAGIHSDPDDGIFSSHLEMGGGRRKTPQSSSGYSNRTASSVPTSCIDIPSTFSTVWYHHPATPGFFVCSRCFTDLIEPTQFRQLFQSSTPTDGQRRHCRFSRPMMKDHIWKNAVSTNYFQPVIDWMRVRTPILDCKGVDGVKGDVGIKWYSARNDSIPGFLLCEACYQDHALTNSLSANFELYPKTQGARDHWACDMALPFIQRQYERDGKTGNWPNFAFEAKSRLGISRCTQQAPVKAYGKKWFCPVNGPAELVLCAACYCDQVIHTGEEPKWQIVPGLTDARDKQVRCALGRFNIRIAMARAHEVKDFSIFWTAIQKLEEHPLCSDDGTNDAKVDWWTLPGNPPGFQICGACYVAITEPMGVSQFFEQKQGIPQGTTLRCCFNVTHPRLWFYMPRLLEAYFTQDPASLVRYATTYASIPPCVREKERTGARWYGWPDCMVCPDCYLSFARQHSALAEQMPLHDAVINGSAMCELYSARMRALYVAAASSTPPDPSDLLHNAQLRRQIYYATVPPMRQLIEQQKLALVQQRMLNTLSTFHTNSGQLQQIASRTPYTYSAPGVGSGFANMDMLQGAAYGQQAMGIVSGAQGAVGRVRILEQQWRAVE